MLTNTYKKRTKSSFHALRPIFFAVLFFICLVVNVLWAADGREQVADQYKWNLADIYPDETAWQNDFDRIGREYIPQMGAYNNKLHSPATVVKALRLYETMARLMEKVYTYAYLKADENQADNDAAERLSKAETLNARVQVAASFLEPELLSKSKATLTAYMNHPALTDYQHFFAVLLLEKPHSLSKNEEAILAGFGDLAVAPENIYKKATVADLKFPVIKDDQGRDLQLTNMVYGGIMQSRDREYRKRAFEAFYGAIDQIKNTLAAVLYSEVKTNVYLAKARHFNSALDAALASENIPRRVYDNLLTAVDNHLDSFHKYIAIRRKVLNLDQVRDYDLMVPLEDNYSLNIPYDKAKTMLMDGLHVLGSDYAKALETGLNSRWIDVYNTPHKTLGGYESDIYDVHPYILLNYSDSLFGLLTLSHEMGHAVNSYFTVKSQSYLNAGIPIFNAEVASTVNELLMERYVMQNAASEQEKLYLLDMQVMSLWMTVYAPVMSAEFEQVIHERVERGEALSAKSLNDSWRNLAQKFYGPDYISEDFAPLEWARIPHLYYDFYVYQYATSKSAAGAIVAGLTGSEELAGHQRRYLQFLAAGSSDYPLAVLKKTGVDMTTGEAVADLLDDFGNRVAKLEEMLRQAGKLQ